MASFVASSAVPPVLQVAAGGRLLLLQGSGAGAGGRALLLRGVGADAGRALVAVCRPRCTAGRGDEKNPTADDEQPIPKVDMEQVPVVDVVLPRWPRDDTDAKTFSEALDAAMEEARLAYGRTAVVIHGDKPLVDEVKATLEHARRLVAAIAKDPAVYKDGSLAALADVEAQAAQGYVSADALLRAMDGLHGLALIVLGGEVAAGLRPYGAHSTGPLDEHDDQANFVWDLSREFAVVVEDIKVAARLFPAVHATAATVTNRQFFLVRGDKHLMEYLTDVAKDSTALLLKMVGHIADGPSPLTDELYHDVLRIANTFIKVEVEAGQGGYARADTVVAAMDGLKDMACVFAGTGVAAGLRHFTPWPTVQIDGEDDAVGHMWKLASALGVLLENVKLRLSVVSGDY